eukprot:Tbor_TRINITY_DN3432_c0_g1::TRINITY_DN3432_c0_g1_i1::g.3772::m.3772/K06640/ATR; serine/threonine-protein kinase ATR
MPQLLSRLSHRNTEAVKSIASITLDVIKLYPQEVLWQVLPLFLSKTNKARSIFIKENIIVPFVRSSPSSEKIYQEMSQLFETLTEICTSSTIASHKLTEVPVARKVISILAGASFKLPKVTYVYPSMSYSQDGETSAKVTFNKGPLWVGFGDKVDVIPSLQKPKRITALDSNGVQHYFLMKSKDEPRKDIRMMEIAMVLNYIFQTDAYSKKNTYSIKRYAVMALNDDCAIIEWVQQTATLRKLVEESYLIDSTGVSITDVRNLKAKCDKGVMTKLDMFQKHILPAAPPVFHQWFQRRFINPLAWYRARQLFTQSSALWSMCGHVVGLGDRHGENLLISVATGEVMHVDFACMFDRGEQLEVPEVVRFRLTPNIVDALGVTGSEGRYKGTCELAMSTLTKNKDIIIGVLETLIHDPLLEWAGKSDNDKKSLINRCRRRLDGFLDLYHQPKDRTALTVSGQVSRLIRHSSSISVLCDMYIWWMAWV